MKLDAELRGLTAVQGWIERFPNAKPLHVAPGRVDKLRRPSGEPYDRGDVLGALAAAYEPPAPPEPEREPTPLRQVPRAA